MKQACAYALPVLGIFLLVLAPQQANASHCSTASMAGDWAYTYTGTIFTSAAPLTAASVGRFSQDSSGNVTGIQTRSVNGDSALEDITGTISVNRDCTGTATINVQVDGQLQRTAVLALVYDADSNHVRIIFQSLTLPDGTILPVVITADGNRLSSKAK